MTLSTDRVQSRRFVNDAETLENPVMGAMIFRCCTRCRPHSQNGRRGSGLIIPMRDMSNVHSVIVRLIVMGTRTNYTSVFRAALI